MAEPLSVKLRAGKYMVPGTITPAPNGIFELKFGYNKHLIAEIKKMNGARWNPNRKIWTISSEPRNIFQLEYLMGRNPYEPYDADHTAYPLSANGRPAKQHQIEMAQFAATRPGTILAGEMGIGKTLSAIIASENLYDETQPPIIYCGPKSGVTAVLREWRKWACRIPVRSWTYPELVKQMANVHLLTVPRIVIFDESSLLKNPTAQRSKAAMLLADTVRQKWGDKARIILLTGTPAPRTPADWWYQCEIAQPGFLAEGNIHKFRNTLAVIRQKENEISGGTYPEIVTWRDDENKCAICGDLPHMHSALDHVHTPGVNEIDRLYRRLKGLVLIKWKRDCLDLPEKIYEVIDLVPAADTLRAAKLIQKTARRAVQALINLRELSDGFQYEDQVVGERVCEECKGAGKATQQIADQDFDPMAPTTELPTFHEEVCECFVCGGTGKVDDVKRVTHFIHTPKDEVFIEQLEAHEEVGRLVTWAGFTATIDKLTEIALKEGWHVLRVDGRGYITFSPDGTTYSKDTFLDAMDRSHENFHNLLTTIPKLVFIGHPKAGGMGLTLTGSPTELFYSNDFDAGARMQAEHRCHRPGMDENRGLRIIDIFHLPTDRMVLDNLRSKRRLQDITMGEIERYLNE